MMKASDARTGLRRSSGIHDQLRRRTRQSHEAVDAAFGRFDLRRAEDYGAFLSAHAAVLPALEAELAPGELIVPWRGRTAALLGDLAALGIPQPETMLLDIPAGQASRWGALYVLEGSRLGGAVLARQIGPDFPSAYLSAVHGPGEWQRILAAIESAADGADWAAQAVAGAEVVFAAYRRAADRYSPG